MYRHCVICRGHCTVFCVEEELVPRERGGCCRCSCSPGIAPLRLLFWGFPSRSRREGVKGTSIRCRFSSAFSFCLILWITLATGLKKKIGHLIFSVNISFSHGFLPPPPPPAVSPAPLFMHAFSVSGKTLLLHHSGKVVTAC